MDPRTSRNSGHRPGEQPIVIIGAGIGGLVAAIECACMGMPVTVYERAAVAGGKVRSTRMGIHDIDIGPTVLTWPRIIDHTLAKAGTSLDDLLEMSRADTLARHTWRDRSQLDLYADPDRSEAAIGALAGSSEAKRFRAFRAESARIFTALEHHFMRAPRTTALGLAARIGIRHLGVIAGIRPFTTLWHALGRHFHDPRLRQLFARYATYCGSSPFECPATLMLIAHVEEQGVWLVSGGMRQLVRALQSVGERLGVRYVFEAEVSMVETANGRVRGVRLASGEPVGARAVVINGDHRAVSDGLLGQDARQAVAHMSRGTRSLSAVTFAMLARPKGVLLDRHNVFFSDDYPAEFEDLCRHGRVPRQPTVYVCAQTRPGKPPGDDDTEPLFCLVNAPPTGLAEGTAVDLTDTRDRLFEQLRSCGLELEQTSTTISTEDPRTFEQRFPGTGGALYGRAIHGWQSSFSRPGSRTSVPGLYLAGGSVHPGAGIPMAAISGQLAAQSIHDDHRNALG